MYSSFIIIYHFILIFIVLCCIQPNLSARNLGDISPSSFTGKYEPPVQGTVQASPPTPVNQVGFKGKTVNNVHSQIVTVNNETRSKSETITGENGRPSIEATKNHGGKRATIYGQNGKPEIKETKTNSCKTEIINGSDGKPQMEVQKFDNGTSIYTIFDGDGKPLLHKITYHESPGNAPNSFAPPAFPPT